MRFFLSQMAIEVAGPIALVLLNCRGSSASDAELADQRVVAVHEGGHHDFADVGALIACAAGAEPKRSATCQSPKSEAYVCLSCGAFGHKLLYARAYVGEARCSGVVVAPLPALGSAPARRSLRMEWACPI